MDDFAFEAVLANNLGKLAMVEAREAIRVYGGRALDLVNVKLKKAKTRVDREIYEFAAEIIKRYRRGDLPSIINLEDKINKKQIYGQHFGHLDECDVRLPLDRGQNDVAIGRDTV